MRGPDGDGEKIGGSPQEPDRLPQRWAIILGIAGVVGVSLAVQVDVAAGATVGTCVIALLHTIMD
ncbi:hypothetical protein [Actinomadura miaoliensis]